MNSALLNSSKALMLFSITALAIGCASQSSLTPQERVQPDLSSSTVFEECLASLAEPLASANNPATYHSSANYALACLDAAPVVTNSIVQTSVMQVHALAIAQFLKAGDMRAATQQLRVFKSRYPNQDLLLEDGASFIHTVELVIGLAPKEQSASNSLLNASSSLKSELRRQQYWQVN